MNADDIMCSVRSESSQASDLVDALAEERHREEIHSEERHRQARHRDIIIEKLYRKHFAELCRTLYRLYGPGPPEAEDLAHQAFEKMQSLDSIEHIENPRAFLYTIAINQGRKSILRIRNAKAYLAEQLNRPSIGLDEIDPSRVYEGREQIGILEKAMATLSAKQREIVIRSRIHGHTYAEIASTTGWSQADISRQLNAAMKVLMNAADAETHLPGKGAGNVISIATKEQD